MAALNVETSQDDQHGRVLRRDADAGGKRAFVP
jgi:hypothetical protein